MQNLTQCGMDKWWRNHPRWLVRGKQVLVKRRLTMCELLRWSWLYPWGFRSIIPKLCWEKQVYYRVTWIQGHIFLWVGVPKSLAQVWNCSWKKNAMLKSQDWQVKVWQDWSDPRLKWLNCVSYLILSIGMPYYQEGLNIDYLTRSKVLIDHPCEDPERKTFEK